MISSVSDSGDTPSRYLDTLLIYTARQKKMGVFLSHEEKIEFYNAGADYWRYHIGVNVIPADTLHKKPIIPWKSFQNDPIPIKLHDQWKSEGLFCNGLAVILGKVWHRKDKEGYYLVGVDADNFKAIHEILSRSEKTISPEKFATRTIVEQHSDSPDKMHFYIYCPRPLLGKASDISRIDTRKMRNNQIPAFEIKSLGEHGIIYCAPSMHKNGFPYTILATYEPATLTEKQTSELEQHFDDISKKYGLQYLDINNGNGKALTPIQDLFKQDFEITEGNNRHEAVLRIAESLIFRNKGILSLDQIRELTWKRNLQICKPPLDKKEFDRQWDCAVDFVRKKNGKDKSSVMHYDGIEDSNWSAASRALALVQQKCSEFFVDQYNRPFAAVGINQHIEVLPMESNRFRNWICKLYYESQNGDSVLTGESIGSILNILKAQATFSGITRILNLRISNGDNTDMKNNNLNQEFYYDLANKKWEIIRITADDGWSIESSESMPIMFKRYSNLQSQVYPVREYPNDIFNRFLDLVNLHDQDTKLLLKCYIISLFIPGIPKPILMLHGEQGSAKSTLQELIKMLVDPSIIRTLTFPRDINELVQQLEHNYVAYFDNVSYIKEWISDQLCRAVTGSGFSKRELYTSDEDIIYNFKRGIGFNGINLGATKADLLDRGIIIQLERIPKEKYRKVEDIWIEFEKIKPQLLGYIFDILTKVLRVKNDGGIRLESRSRMADFEEVSEIISRCMDYKENEFLNVYCSNMRLQTEEALEASPVATSIIKLIELRTGEWEGTATELLAELETIAATQLRINTKTKLWPKRPNILTRRINEVRTNLREIGITIEKFTINTKTGLGGLRISKQSSESSDSSEIQNYAQNKPRISDDNRSADHILSEENKISSVMGYNNHAQSEDSYDSYDSYLNLHQ
ncbi:MAG: hypothetical protein GEU26_04765 [Nitrososphaeraceae archaeon]|nr:hypothetical protein [Nitrososphaeraceae archaeon]